MKENQNLSHAWVNYNSCNVAYVSAGDCEIDDCQLSRSNPVKTEIENSVDSTDVDSNKEW